MSTDNQTDTTMKLDESRYSDDRKAYFLIGEEGDDTEYIREVSLALGCGVGIMTVDTVEEMEELKGISYENDEGTQWLIDNVEYPEWEVELDESRFSDDRKTYFLTHEEADDIEYSNKVLKALGAGVWIRSVDSVDDIEDLKGITQENDEWTQRIIDTEDYPT